MLKTFKYLKPYIIPIVFIFIFVGTRAFLDLQLPRLMGEVFDEAASSKDAVTIKNEIMKLGLQMLGITFLSIIVTVVSGFLESRVSAKYAQKLREEVYKKVEQFSLYDLDELTVSSLITRTTNDIQQVQSTVNMLLRMVILMPFIATGAIILAISKEPTLSLVLVASIISLVILITFVFIVTMPKFGLIQKLVDKLNLVTRENLKGLKVVRAYDMETYQEEKISKVADDNRKLNIFVNRIFTLMWPGASLIMGLTSLTLAYFSLKFGFISTNSSFTPGDLTALIQYSNRTIMSFMMLTMILIAIPRASISAKRIMEVIDRPLIITDNNSAVILSGKIEGEIKFNHVSFKYPNALEDVLTDINFTAHKNKVTAFIGSTGSGKSTLINLIPRLYDTTSGSVTIDGIDIKDIKLSSLYQHIGYVPQQGVLFKGTILSNIGFARNTTNDDIKKAALISQSQDFIESFPDSYSHSISQGGKNVSGGQRQRLSIARALAKNAEILIFDDSFSALDYKTDKNLRKALKENVSATILVVAQRINTIKDADKIIVLDKGMIVGEGTHEELLKTCPVYIEIAESQLSKEELEHAR